MSKRIVVDRPPRIQPELPAAEIPIPAPPDKPSEGHARLIQFSLPLITILGYVLVSTLGGPGRSPLLMVPMALSVVASTAFSIYTYIKEKQQRRELEQGYAARLTELNQEMHVYHDMQRRFYRYNYPDAPATLQTVRDARAQAERTEPSLRSKARLWERRVTDDDFGAVRLGTGTLPSTVVYTMEDRDDTSDQQLREALKIAGDSRFVSDIPIIISFRHPSEAQEEQEQREGQSEDDDKRPDLTPLTHALGVVGTSACVYEFARAMLSHYVVFHAPMDAKLYVLAAKKQEWAWAQPLPHCQADEQSSYLCFIDQIQDADDDSFDDDEGSELDRFLEGIRKVLAQRKIRLQEHHDNTGDDDPTLPLLLVVVDLLDLAGDAVDKLRSIESDAAISILLDEGARLGAAVVFLVPERSKVPSGCSAVIEIERTTPATNSKIEQLQRLYFRYAETGVNSFRYVGAADGVAAREDVTALAQEMAALTLRQSGSSNLSSTVLFLDLMGFSSLEDLRNSTMKSWGESVEPQHANWLRVKLGLMSGNKPRTLVFSAKRDGVHGMVAGSTGSGKSELLISMICGLAVTYDPTVLNFVLVDYKGGGAFKEFESLPHCVDIITNLGGDGVTRMFTAINSEMQRRQALNAETGTKNIVEYRQKGLHRTHHPYPYLFIIIDEFAEMIADRAEFKSQLESITRVGRAQGVNLLLAAQRPSGVTDQMRSNIKFRICLRVESPGESREMLRRSDAAFLPTGVPGRGYLQVGNEEIELIQSAYTGDKYVEPAQAQRDKVIWPDRAGKGQAAQDQTPQELYKVIIGLLNDLALQQKIRKQRAPWPGFLPRNLALSQRLTSDDPNIPAVTFDEYLVNVDQLLLGQQRDQELTLNPSINRWFNRHSGWVEQLDWKRYAMRPVIGLIDNPYAAKQLPLVIDFPRGHVVLFGASGWGKTTFIRSLIVSLAASHSPNHFHAYVLDLGGRNLQLLGELPHVGAVIIPDEEGYEERVAQLLREIDDIAERRKTLLSNAGVPDIYEYNHANPQNAQPAILVAIDNFLEFAETFGGGQDNVATVLDSFIALARQAKPYGIHFVITVSRTGDLSSQLYSLFTERLTLKLAEEADYRMIVGGQPASISDIAGRGYVRVGNQPLSFQIAAPFELHGSNTESGELEEFAEILCQYIADVERTGQRRYLRPMRVDSLPKAVLFKQLLARENQLELDRDFVPKLTAITQQRWQQSRDAAYADWLKVVIGVIPGNRPRLMELEAKKDGVHGMVAGGTGAGKSELLMTLIVALACNYDPSILNFVLVDYKGGGAFAPFRGLPHVVDLITNLNKAAVRRMFTAINAEMQRRQLMNAETGTKDIVEYRQKGLHLTRAPYPHLFIIIDEYAEMISDSPEFKAELDSITRVGRAQGVNLLLASQRPTGVSDQMRANIKFRICLRVEDVETSREMLRRSDAAFLPSGMPGRGYMQVGNENIELIQMAYTGETYNEAQVPEGGEKPKFYDVLVQMANTILDGERPRTPWPPFLSTALQFSDPLIPAYLDQSTRPLIQLGRTERLALNPFLVDWLNGKGRWGGIDWGTTAMRAIVGMLDNPHQAAQAPLVVDFTKGHAVLFGASGWGKTTFIRSLMMSLAGTHSPDEFHAHVLDLGGRNLEVLGALPHVGTIIMPDEQGYEERVQQLWREMNEVVDERKRLFSAAGVSTLPEYNTSGAPILPAILVAIDNFGEYIESFGNPNQADDENNLLSAFVGLARQGKPYGLHFIITATRLNILSSKLYSLFTERFTMRLSDSGDYSAIVGAQIPEIEEIPGRGYARAGRIPLAFQVALPPGTVDEKGQVRGEAGQIRLIGQQMQVFIDGQSHRYREPLRIGALPKSSSYRQLITEELGLSGDSFVEALRRAMRQTWTRTGSADDADWLDVTLGIASGNRRRTLHLEAKQDGVHGMVAGGTGSGKSELLMTLIVGLALRFDPSILNFVLVDYKGGGAFKPFETMPHVVDIVTNLNKAAVDRMFTAINAEIRRRQALNAATGTKDIVEYRKKGLHLDPAYGPYPHLFIIIDEYAEMLDANPEYLPALESITRVGRAQGVNLLLASQRPKGVSDQMRANIKLRLCLRVEQADTSRELLRRPDAAFLPNGIPGRGYLQVGNENLELLQVSYTGEKQPDDRPPPVLWPDRPAQAQQAGDEVPRLFDTVVTLSRELVDFQATPKPWPGFLPTTFSLQSPLLDAQRNRSYVVEPAVSDWLNADTATLWPGIDWRMEAMRPSALLVDEPGEARQFPHAFDLSRNHLAIFGDSGMGKTSLLRTILTSLAATHTPDDLHCYVLDLGGRNFRSLEGLPHMGVVLYADEETFDERLQRLLEKLGRMVEEHGQLLADADSANLYEYNERYPDRRLPAVLVAIDNFAVLQESYEALIEATLLPLVRRSLSAGITFVATANTPTNMFSKLYAPFSERITLKQSNTDRYMDIVGRGAIELDDIPGRGYIRLGRQPLMFQAALPVGLFDAEGRELRPEGEELRLMAEHMRQVARERKLGSTPPDPIHTLPEVVPLAQMLRAAGAPPARAIQAVLGEDSTLEPALFDLKRVGPHCAVVGPPLSGKTTTLYNWVLSLAERYSPDQVMIALVDTQGKLASYGGAHSLAALPHVVASVVEFEELEPFVVALKNECAALAAQTTSREVFVFIDNFDDFNEELERDRNLPRELAAMARRHGADGLHIVVAGTLDGPATDLRRRIQASGFGIGLRTSQALDALRVLRTPPAVRGKELQVGRGYRVKSGQATLMQVATPYDGPPGTNLDRSSADEQELQARALDSWVERIQRRYPTQRAAWSGQPAQPAAGQQPKENPKLGRMIALLRSGMQREAERLRAGNGDGDGNGNGHAPHDLIVTRLIEHDPTSWTSETVVRDLLRELWIKERVSSGLPREMLESMSSVLDDESLLLELESTLGEG